MKILHKPMAAMLAFLALVQTLPNNTNVARKEWFTVARHYAPLKNEIQLGTNLPSYTQIMHFILVTPAISWSVSLMTLQTM